MQAVILAGGFGTRLRLLTNTIPKPIADIEGWPFLEYQLEMLKKNGFRDFTLCAGYSGEMIEEYFGDGSGLGINIIYSKDNTLLETGGALKNAVRLLEDEFVLVYGDSFLYMDYRTLIKEKKLCVYVTDQRFYDIGIFDRLNNFRNVL